MKKTLSSVAQVLISICLTNATAQDDSKTIRSFYSKSDFPLSADPNSKEWKSVQGVIAESGPRRRPDAGPQDRDSIALER